MPQHDKKTPQTVSAPKEAMQGLSMDLTQLDDPMGALELARDYRGDTQPYPANLHVHLGGVAP